MQYLDNCARFLCQNIVISGDENINAKLYIETVWPEFFQDFCRRLASSSSRLRCLHQQQIWLKTGLLSTAVNIQFPNVFISYAYAWL